ncbi:SGNH/GDSL hydrolase family protein [Streptomyces sp. NPDC014864]|uniref:SGNH/GDSL hydrolase family protein n=1 Tax=Streptomyces sp. NPDC014864 TaxID=3364924 RepID=UPI003701F939
MRQSRIASWAAAALLVSGGLTAAAPAQAVPRSEGAGYVALGDSYSAGVGAGAYLGSSGNCLRSSHAYPALWAAEHAPSSFGFTACDGARATDVLTDQLGPLGAGTTLVTLTVGGSDAGFGRVMTTCVLLGSSACRTAVADANAYMDETLPPDLDRLYTAISDRAPAAHVVVLGYPYLYKLNGLCTAGLTDSDRAAIDDAVDHLDSVIHRRAARHGFTFADVRGAFSDHEICSGSPWMRSVNLLAPNESYHPTPLGQSHGYLPVLTTAA